MMTAVRRPVDLRSVLDLIRQQVGLAFEGGRLAAAEAAIARAMSRLSQADAAEYCRLLEGDAHLLAALVDDLTVGETYFFREPAHFDFIRARVLPALAARGPSHVIRAWSAGCASGEEAYSLAILLDQAGLGPVSRVLATDVAPSALAKARRARFRDWSLRGPGREAALPYLRREGDGYQLEERIARRVTFEPLNLALDTYPSFANGTWGVDLLLCRNVLIYFDRQTVATVARRLAEALAPGGWLITASSDPLLGDYGPLEVMATDKGIFYRRAGGPQPASVGPAVASTRIALDPWDDAHYTPAPSEPASEDRPIAVPAGPVTRSAVAARVRELANRDPAAAQRHCAEALVGDPLAVELHYLHAVLLLSLDQPRPAADAARRALFLNRDLIVGHFALGSALRQAGDTPGALRALGNARRLAAALPSHEIVPLADGERAGRLAEAARQATLLLGIPGEGS
jgi:chemotaxis protein methyltransferase CheR